MQSTLTLALIQADIFWHQPEKNRSLFSDKINQLSEIPDLILLPEMFSTGFSMTPKLVAETMEGPTVNWMKATALKTGAAIGGSLIISENDYYYNRFVFVYPSGKTICYDKRHLFSLAGEHEVYSAGTSKEIIDYKSWKICPLICYDLRFPVWSRNVDNYDLLVYVANWPKPRISAWDALLKARAIENMSYTVGVNRVGVDANKFEYIGHSAAYNALGEPLTSTTEEHETVLMVTLEKPHLEKMRSRLNFLNDKDQFSL